MGVPILLAFICFAVWLIRRDTRRREGISACLWIPTFFAAVELSRPLSFWVGFGGGTDSLEGSPVDRLFYFGLICASLFVLCRRGLNWREIIKGDWPIFLFYGFFLVSVSWADSPFVSFKRWFKDIGLVWVSLVILTEKNPMEAIRTVFLRCAYILLPLSVILIRWFPSWGRFYSRHGGGGEITGVATQKNSLGLLALVCGIMLLWDWLEGRRDRPLGERVNQLNRYLPFAMFLMAIYLIYLSQSKTSQICLFISAVLIAAAYIPRLAHQIPRFGVYILAVVGGYYLLDATVGITEPILNAMGRDMSFTGRTEVWETLLALNIDPFFGTGFCSFWSDPYYQSKLPYSIGSAHNGYLETWIDGGWLGISVLAVMLTAIWFRINRDLRFGDPHYAVVRLAAFLAIAIGSFAESHFGRLSPLWLLFLLTAIEPRTVARALPARWRREGHPILSAGPETGYSQG